MKIDLKNCSKKEIYEYLQLSPLRVSEKELSVIMDRCRFDARLFEIVTEHVRDFWWATDAEYLNQYCKKAKSKFVIKCIAACLLEYCHSDDCTKKEFINWMILATRGISDPPSQLFLIASYSVGSRKEQEQVTHGLACFKNHNIFYADLPFNKVHAKNLKSVRSHDKSKVNDIDLIKVKAVLRIKKLSHQLKNSEVIQKTGINRLFLSKILNNKTEDISAEYLFRVAGSFTFETDPLQGPNPAQRHR